MFFSSFKGINRVISKGMSNIYLKVLIEKTWRFQNFDFLNLKNLSPGQFLGGSNSRRYYWIKLLEEKKKIRAASNIDQKTKCAFLKKGHKRFHHPLFNPFSKCFASK